MAPTMKEIKREKSKKESALKKNTKSGQKKRNKNDGNVSLASYIHKVLKGIHPNIGISKKGMDIMESFMTDMFERIAFEASQLVKLNKHRTLLASDIQTAVKLILPGDLSKHALIEGAKALDKYHSSKNLDKYSRNLRESRLP